MKISRGLPAQLVSALGVPPLSSPEWMVFGSGAMYLHGLRQEIGDVDLFVTPAKWGELIGRGWDWETPRAGDPPIAATDIDGLPRLNAFFAWDGRHDRIFDFEGGIVKAAFAEAKWHRGVWCQSLLQLLRWKEWLFQQGVHEKHGRDADAIRDYLGQ